MGFLLGVLTFLPASNIFFRVGFVIAERVLYLPSAGFILIVVLGIRKLCKEPLIKEVSMKYLSWLNEKEIYVCKTSDPFIIYGCLDYRYMCDCYAYHTIHKNLSKKWRMEHWIYFISECPKSLPNECQSTL